MAVRRRRAGPEGLPGHPFAARGGMNRPGVSGRSWRWEQLLGEGCLVTVVGLLNISWGEICAGGVQPAVIVPVDPFEGRQLDSVEVAPRSSPVDHLGLEQSDLALGQSVVIGVADRADRRCCVGFGEPFGVPQRHVLG